MGETENVEVVMQGIVDRQRKKNGDCIISVKALARNAGKEMDILRKYQRPGTELYRAAERVLRERGGTLHSEKKGKYSKEHVYSFPLLEVPKDSPELEISSSEVPEELTTDERLKRLEETIFGDVDGQWDFKQIDQILSKTGLYPNMKKMELNGIDTRVENIEDLLSEVSHSEAHTGEQTLETRLSNMEGMISIFCSSHRGHTNFDPANFKEMHGFSPIDATSHPGYLTNLEKAPAEHESSSVRATRLAMMLAIELQDCYNSDDPSEYFLGKTLIKSIAGIYDLEVKG